MAAVREYTNVEFSAMLCSRYFRRREPVRNRLLLAIQGYMGPRVHEALALKVDDVFNDKGHIKSKIWFKKTKQGQKRELDIPDALHPFLIAWRARLLEQGRFSRGTWLFVRDDGRAFTVDQASYLYSMAHAELGIVGCGTHSPRKLWASRIHAYWVDRQRDGEHVDPLAKTAKMGGWKSIDSCARYIGLEKYNEHTAINIVANEIGRKL